MLATLAPWLALVAIVIVVIVAIVLVYRSNQKAQAAQTAEFKEEVLGYQKEKQEHLATADRAREALKPPEPYSGESAAEFLHRSKRPWPPPKKGS